MGDPQLAPAEPTHMTADSSLPSRRFLFAGVLACAAWSTTLCACQPTQDPKDPAIPEDTEITTTASGLKISFLKRGESDDRPTASDKVRVHYTGWLTDGTLFDSSRTRGNPSEFFLNQVVPGWTEGLQLMAVGDRAKLTIPSALGYGSRAKGKIPADSVLIFDVELLEITQKLPTFTKADPEKQSKLPSTPEYTIQLIKSGTGDKVGTEHVAALRYAVFSGEGRMLDCSERQGPGRQVIKSKAADLPQLFMQAVVPEMCKGDRWRVEVTPEQGNARVQGTDDVVWELELIDILKPKPMPEFRKPDSSKVVKTDSGLMYEVLKAGTGEMPKRTDNVRVNYAGWLPDGTNFDSSFSRGEPTQFGVGQVIPGWTEGLMTMKPGEIRIFEIPSELAYGTRGAPPDIKANQDLIFYVEYLGKAEG